MKRMNLLPAELRPRDSSRHGSSYVVVAALGAAVAAMIAYGMVISGVRNDETELISLKDETRQAQARADALSPYGEFADMKDRREQSVRTVADSRFDYERLTRELAQILPAGVWVGHLEVAPAPPAEEVVAAGADAQDVAPPDVPQMTVSGCAPDQDVVADTLDRLRALTGASDVALGSSSHSDTSAAASAGGRKPYLVSGSGGSGDCGRDGLPRVSFDATVTLTAPAAAAEVTPVSTGTGTGS